MNERNKEQDLSKLADAFFNNLERETRCEYGGWGLDDKRPFGNSSVDYDILEIIGYKWDSGDDLPREAQDYTDQLYNELGGYLLKEWTRLRMK